MVNKMTLFHGAGNPLTLNSDQPIYASGSIEDAREFALGLDDLGNHNEESFIYAIEVEGEVTEIDDFDEFDNLAYGDTSLIPEISHNADLGWYCIKHPVNVTLVEHYINEI